MLPEEKTSFTLKISYIQTRKIILSLGKTDKRQKEKVEAIVGAYRRCDKFPVRYE